MSTKLAAMAAAACALSLSAFAEKIIIRPKEIRGVLVNPGMGITTFQRYNGDALNSGLKWSEAGPTEPLAEPQQKPDFPETSVAYVRWFWATLEPEHGKVHWEIVDAALEQARVHGQTLAIRLMPYDPQHPLPEWYRNSGAPRANKPTDKDGKIWQPDFSDPLFLKYWGEVVAAAGQRYDGHPLLDSVDISSIGYWGEGWSDYMPAFEHQKPLVDIWFDAFKRTPLLMNFDEPHALVYGTSRGAGWRFDCLGDMRERWSHMRDFYPEQIARTRIGDVWRRSPVSMETCWVPAYWKEHGWDVRYILNEALRWHISTLNVKSSSIPSEWKEIFNDFQSRMGYRFALRRIEYDRETHAGSMLPLTSWWVNEGVAPVYRAYTLAFQFKSPSAEAVSETAADVRKWLPGDAVFEEPVYVPGNLPAGEYRLRVALLDPRTHRPVIRLAIEGRGEDGWYDVGPVTLR